jgi:hypothetical protein
VQISFHQNSNQLVQLNNKYIVVSLPKLSGGAVGGVVSTIGAKRELFAEKVILSARRQFLKCTPYVLDSSGCEKVLNLNAPFD